MNVIGSQGHMLIRELSTERIHPEPSQPPPAFELKPNIIRILLPNIRNRSRHVLNYFISPTPSTFSLGSLT